MVKKVISPYVLTSSIQLSNLDSLWAQLGQFMGPILDNLLAQTLQVYKPQLGQFMNSNLGSLWTPTWTVFGPNSDSLWAET